MFREGQGNDPNPGLHSRNIPLIAGEVVRALRHTYSLILRVNNMKRRVTLRITFYFISKNT